MIAVWVGRLFHLFMPGGALLLAGILFSHSMDVIHWRPIVAKVLLLVVPAASLLVCWRFNKFKPAFAVLVLTLAEWSLQNYCRGGGLDVRLAEIVKDAVAILVPLNLAWLVLGREKGLFNVSGLAKLLLIAVQPLLIIAIYSRRPEIFTYLGKDFLPLGLLLPGDLAHLAIVAYLFALTVLIINFFKQRGVIDNGFVWALIASYFGIGIQTGLLSTVFLMLGGLILVVSVVEAAYIMAFRDDLTGLPARRALNELLLRLRGDYTIAMLDIDFFKKFNDSYGHHVGDQVLKMVAVQIGRVGGGGRPFRYGGEEFTVVFSGKKVEAAAIHLEKVRMSIEAAGFSLRNKTRPKIKHRGRKGRGNSRQSDPDRVGVTISIGAASNGKRTLKPEQIIKKADMALYKAKKDGRNRVVF